MENRTKGAWLINHSKKLEEFTNTNNFEEIQLAGKCGVFLSNLSATNEESNISQDKVDVIATNCNINKKLELPTIKNTLKEAQLIDYDTKGNIVMLGITSDAILNHTSNIFEQIGNTPIQNAALELSNSISNKPIDEDEAKEYISDTYKIDSKANESLFIQAEEFGFVDFETIDDKKTYFNGNLFKRDTISKTSKVLDSLSSEESNKLRELDSLIIKEGGVDLEKANLIVGDALLGKIRAIGLYDCNEVSNSKHRKIYLTKPSAFAKFGNPFEEDVLDLAKAFISSLLYGIQFSNTMRGRIQSYSMAINMIKKLLRGESVGPCTAIGQDYYILELNRVIQLMHNGNGFYNMKLLKYDIARIALEVLEKGEVAETTVINDAISSSSLSMYKGPEKLRKQVRKRKDGSIKPDITELVRIMR